MRKWEVDTIVSWGWVKSGGEKNKLEIWSSADFIWMEMMHWFGNSFVITAYKSIFCIDIRQVESLVEAYLEFLVTMFIL